MVPRFFCVNCLREDCIDVGFATNQHLVQKWLLLSWQWKDWTSCCHVTVTCSSLHRSSQDQMPTSTNAIYKAAAQLWKLWLEPDALLTLSQGECRSLSPFFWYFIKVFILWHWQQFHIVLSDIIFGLIIRQIQILLALKYNINQRWTYISLPLQSSLHLTMIIILWLLLYYNKI